MTLIDRATALTALRCLDLTSLKADEPPHEIQELIERAATIHGPVAAVCLYAKHLDQPYFSLPDARIKIATVVNFPLGTQSPDQVARETTGRNRQGRSRDRFGAPLPGPQSSAGGHKGLPDSSRIKRIEGHFRNRRVGRGSQYRPRQPNCAGSRGRLPENQHRQNQSFGNASCNSHHVNGYSP